MSVLMIWCVGLVKSLLKNGIYTQCLVQSDHANSESKGIPCNTMHSYLLHAELTS